MDFGRHSSLRVSEYALRSTARGYGSDPTEARRVFDRYAERGGNFLDTTHFYQFGDSERLLADFVASNRNDFILATNSVSAAPFKPLNDNRQQPRRHDSFWWKKV